MLKRSLLAFFSLSLVLFFAQVSDVRADDNLSPFFLNWNPVVTATATQSYSYDVDATDPESDPIVFSLLSAPAGMTIDSGTGVISWTPDASQASSTAYAVEVQIADATHTLSRTYQLLVSGSNLSPFFLNWNPVLTATTTQSYSYDVEATDPESDPLVFSLLAAPAGMTIDSGTGLISWTPDNSQASTTSYTVTVQVSDPTHNVSRDFQVLVSEATSTGGGNLSPFFLNWNPVVSATATQPYSYDVDATDPESDPLIFSLVSSTPSGMTINASSGLIEWTPTADQATSTPYTVTVQVSDPTHSISRDFQILVAEATSTGGGGGNLSPFFLNWNPVITATATMPYSYDVNAFDPESDPLIFSLVSSTPSGMTINASSGLIEWTPTADQATSTPYTVTVQVSDPTHSISRDFQLSVASTTPTSTPPCTSNCGGGGGGGGGGGSITLVPVSNPSCPPSCGGGGGGSITVTNQNLPPYFVNFNPPTAIFAGDVYLYDTNAVDPEGQPLTFSLLQAPSGMNILPSNGLIYWAPGSEFVRSEPYTVLIQVSDGLLVATTSYAITVHARPVIVTTVPNEPPASPKATTTIATTTPATTTVSVVTAGNPLLALLTNIADWFRDNYCVLGYLLWLLTILAWIAYLLLGDDEDEDHEEIVKELEELPEEPVDLTSHEIMAHPEGSTTFQTVLNEQELRERKSV